MRFSWYFLVVRQLLKQLAYASLLPIIKLNFTSSERKVLINYQKILKIIWTWFSAKFYFPSYVFINSFNCWKQLYFGWNLFYLSKKNAQDQTWRAFNSKFGSQWEDRESSYQIWQILAFFSKLVTLNLG